MTASTPSGPADERPEGRHAQRRPGPALPGHLVAVDAGDHGGGFPRDVHQDGSRRPAVHGPVVNPRQHDQRGHHVHPDGDRKEQGDGGRGTQPGQDADHRPDE